MVVGAVVVMFLLLILQFHCECALRTLRIAWHWHRRKDTHKKSERKANSKSATVVCLRTSARTHAHALTYNIIVR